MSQSLSILKDETEYLRLNRYLKAKCYIMVYDANIWKY